MPRRIDELTAAVAAGDPEAFTAFYRAWFDHLYAEARRICRRDEDFCMDVVQDVFLRVVRRLRTMQTEDDLRAWLHVVVRSCAYDRLRRETARRRHEGAAASVPASTEPVEDTADQIAALRRELAYLDPHTAGMVVLRHRFGWTLHRIGQALGLTPGAVDGRVRRATEQLRTAAENAHG